MSYARLLCLLLICCACMAAAPCFAQISSNTLVLFHSMPELDGTTPPEHAIYLLPGTTHTFTGAKIDQAGGLTLAALETPADHHVLITDLIIRAKHRVKVKWDNGNDPFLAPYSVPWTITAIPDGVELRWRPGAGKLGQYFGGTNGHDRYTLILSVNQSENPGVNFTALDRNVYTVTALPEPGITAIFCAGLIATGALASRRKRRAHAP